MLASAAIGGATDLGLQVLNNALSGCSLTRDISWAQAGVSSVLGGATGGVGAAAGAFTRAAAVELSSREIVELVAREQANRGTQALLATLSTAERNAYLANPAGGSRFIGQAVHNETARELTRRYGDGRFIYRRRGPDFLDSETGAVVELTTPRQVTRHVNRPGYGSVIDYATYELP